MRIIMTLAAAHIFLVGAADPQLALPGWMAGCWEQKTGDRWTEECWTTAQAGMMLGSSRSGQGDTIRLWEAMQIISNDKATHSMTFYAAPNGINRTAFTWVPAQGRGVTFVNDANDYPQRIRYWRDGDKLLAEISMKDGSKAMRWEYTRK